MTPINKASLSEQIYVNIRSKIISQEYKSGQKLTIKELQNEYNVSNTPIREALTRLDHEGLVEFTTNQSAKVFSLTRNDIVEVNDLCSLLDCYAVKLAMENQDSKGKMEADLIQAINRDCSSDSNYESSTWDNSFHAVFYKYANQGRLKKMALQYSGHFLLIARVQCKQDRVSNYEQHLEIIEAVKTGNIEKAVEKMKDHYEISKKRLLESLK